MTKISVTTNASGFLDILGKIKDIARKPFDAGRGELVRRRSVAVFREQFSRGGYFGPNGLITWTPTQPFGSKPATVPPFGGGGSLLAAMAGGPGGSWTSSANKVKMSLSLIYAAIHHEGGKIGVTPKLRGFVGFTFGVNLRSDKTAIIMPRRPLYDVRSPQLIDAARKVVLEAVTEATT